MTADPTLTALIYPTLGSTTISDILQLILYRDSASAVVGFRALFLSDEDPGHLLFSGTPTVTMVENGLDQFPMFFNTRTSEYFTMGSDQIGAGFMSDPGVAPAPVPEPSSFALLLTGLGAVGRALHRRARSKSSGQESGF